MKVIAVLLNLGLLVFVCLMLVKEGMPSAHEGGFWIVLLLSSAPVASLAAITWKRQGSGHRSFLSLYFERRRLEEQKRINELR